MPALPITGTYRHISRLDKDETIAAYFPEVGIVADITKSFGMSLSARRYYSLYEEDEDVIMLGLVFKK